MKILRWNSVQPKLIFIPRRLSPHPECYFSGLGHSVMMSDRFPKKNILKKNSIDFFLKAIYVGGPPLSGSFSGFHFRLKTFENHRFSSLKVDFFGPFGAF